jgi:hypothetical protein
MENIEAKHHLTVERGGNEERIGERGEIEIYYVACAVYGSSYLGSGKPKRCRGLDPTLSETSQGSIREPCLEYKETSAAKWELAD